MNNGEWVILQLSLVEQYPEPIIGRLIKDTERMLVLVDIVSIMDGDLNGVWGKFTTFSPHQMLVNKDFIVTIEVLEQAPKAGFDPEDDCDD